MALQHFYARVPARVSMFNKADGFDTFAHSEGLDREFIERELSVVYDNKLSKNDIDKVRRGELTPIYLQCRLRSGKTVQSCIRFLPLDYTGERSAYFVHSLILSEEERQELFFHKQHLGFCREVFNKEISAFDLTSPTSAADNAYPTTAYPPLPIADSGSVTAKYQPETIKSFIYAVLASLIGKGKNVYFKMPADGTDTSLSSLDFINEIVKILPFHLRESLSFVTRITEYTQYASFKLKGVSADCAEIPTAKGVFFDLQTDLITGLQHDEVVANKALIGFLYSLLDNNELRCEYLSYIHQTVSAIPQLQNMNIKTLTDLTFLFWQCCGLYSDQSILPNDGKIFDFLVIYEKYRAALSDEYHINAYRFLSRYVKNHTAIPKNIFAKLGRLYPSEIPAAQNAVMNVVLQLIHTDIMRDKLFVFVRNNYRSQDEASRRVIQDDLCRVFYGGFLQKQILAFFAECFADEPADIQQMIVDKLLLSIRTVAIQGGILAFFEQFYAHLTDAQKQAFYKTFYEMLPECDALAAEMVSLVNRVIAEEAPARREEVASAVLTLLEADNRKKEHLMLPLLTAQPGFCSDIVRQQVLGPWNTRKIFGEYIALLQKKPFAQKTAIVLAVAQHHEALSEEALAHFLSSLPALFAADCGRVPLYRWLEADAQFKQADIALYPQWQEAVSFPGIAASLSEVFHDVEHKALLEQVTAFAEQHPSIKDGEAYQMITTYQAIIRAAKDPSKAQEALVLAAKLPSERSLRADIARYMTVCAIEQSALPPEQAIVLYACINWLKSESIGADRLYRQFYEQAVKADTATDTKTAEEKYRNSAVNAMQLLLDWSAAAYGNGQELSTLFESEKSAYINAIRSFMNSYGRQASKWLHSYMTHHHAHAAFFGYYASLEKQIKAAQGSFLSRLFKK